jgi:hypothetical protein
MARFMPRIANGALPARNVASRSTSSSERFPGHHGGEVADPQHFRRGDLLRGQKQLFGVVDAEPRHIAGDAALVIVQAEPRRRHEHLGRIDADAEIAGQRQVGRAAIDAAIEPADRRHAEVLQAVDHRLERRSRARLRRRAGGAVRHRIEIVAGAEGAAGAGQHQHADRGIGLDPVEQFYEVAEILALQPVQMLSAG